MRCPNPACRKELFKVRVVWKQKVKAFPEFLPVELRCARCGRKIKAYVLNEDMRNVLRVLTKIYEGMKMLLEESQAEEPKKEPWWKFW